MDSVGEHNTTRERWLQAKTGISHVYDRNATAETGVGLISS